MKHLKPILIAFLIITTLSCSKDDDSQDDDIRQLVENFVTPDLIQTLEELGFNFNDGEEQPDISGSFLFNPVLLEASNIPNDSPVGTLFSDLTTQFSELNPENRSFTFISTQGTGSQSEAVTNTFYSGNGNSFSAYAKLSLSTNGEFVVVLYAFSGNITESGITNTQYALIMLDDNNVENVIENGQGRLFIDENGTANRLE